MNSTVEISLVAALIGVVATVAALFPWFARRARREFERGLTHAADTARVEQQLLEERLEVRVRETLRVEAQLRALGAERDRLQAENRSLAEHVASLGARGAERDRRMQELDREVTEVRAAARDAITGEAALRTRLEEAARTFAEKEAHFQRTGELLKSEFQLLAQRIFEEQGQSFAQSNRVQIDGLLSPFREQLSEFKQRVEQVYLSDSKDRASLLNEVRNLQRASERINLETENLTRALKGDKRVQGNWGELVLERVLADSGLRRDFEYSVQASRRTDDGEPKRPDVIIHLPDEKDVVVDAKVSLAAYERALATEDDVERERLLRQHVADLRAQVKRLAEQDYDRLQGVRSLDFVLLFVPIESAFTIAMQQDESLFTEAFDRRIVIVSPTTLMMTLRIIHNVWRYEKQSRNAQEIARRAGALYDKLRAAMEDMARLGSTLRSAEQTFDEAMKKLSTGKGNLVRQVEHLRELGAPVKRAFARETLEASDADPDMFGDGGVERLTSESDPSELAPSGDE